MAHHQVQRFPERKPENTVLLSTNFILQWPALRHTGISCCSFRDEAFLLPVAIKPPTFCNKTFANEKKTNEGMILEQG